MIFLRIDTKRIKHPLIALIIFFLGFCIYNYAQNSKNASLESLLCNSEHLPKSDLISFIASENGSFFYDIEIFDIRREKVIKRIESDASVQKEAALLLRNITGIYAGIKAIPEKGYIIRIPLNPPVMIKNQWLNDTVDEVFIIFPEQSNPYLLILDDKSRPLLYNFEGNIDKLLKAAINSPDITPHVDTIGKLDETEITALEKENSTLNGIIDSIVPKDAKIIYEDPFRNMYKNLENFTPPYIKEQSLQTVLDKGKKVGFKILSYNPSYLRPLYNPDWKSAFFRGWLHLPNKNINARHRMFIYPFGGSSIYDFTGELGFESNVPIDYHRNLNFLIYNFKVTDVVKYKHQVLIAGSSSMTGAQVISIVQNDLLEKDEDQEDFLFHLSTPQGYELDYIYGNVIRYEYLLKVIKENTVSAVNADIEALDNLLTENMSLKKKLAFFVPFDDKLITQNQGKPIAPAFPYEVPNIETIVVNGKEITFTTNYNNSRYKRPVYDPLWMENYKRRWCYIPKQISLNLQTLFLIPSDPKEQYDLFGMLSFHEDFGPLSENNAGFLVYNFCVDKAIVYKSYIILIGKPSRQGAQIISINKNQFHEKDYIIQTVTPDNQVVDYTLKIALP